MPSEHDDELYDTNAEHSLLKHNKDIDMMDDDDDANTN